MHHGTLFKHIYNNYSPGLFSSSYVQAKLTEVSFFVQSIYIYIYMGHFQKNVHSHGKDTVEKKLKVFQFKMVDLVR